MIVPHSICSVFNGVHFIPKRDHLEFHRISKQILNFITILFQVEEEIKNIHQCTSISVSSNLKDILVNLEKLIEVRFLDGDLACQLRNQISK